MKIDRELILNVAKNARLSLSEEEIIKFTQDMKDILGNFSKLDKVDTKNVKASFQPVEIKNDMREDIPGKCLSQEEALKNTEHKKDGYFQGPRAV